MQSLNLYFNHHNRYYINYYNLYYCNQYLVPDHHFNHCHFIEFIEILQNYCRHYLNFYLLFC